MLIPAFTFNLNRPVTKGLVTFGKFDGKHPSIAVATAGDSVVVHSPHQRNDAMEHEVRELAINRNITALASGDMKLEGDEFKGHELILVGTTATFQAYNLEDNRDVFYKDISDGVTQLIHGQVPGIDAPLAIVGGNCSIQGFDATGEEVFWTVTGENVTAFALREKDGIMELLAASEDYHIRVFHAEAVIAEIREADIASTLTSITLKPEAFGFALANGSVGVYNDVNRVWHEKTGAEVVDVTSYDLDADGVAELIIGLSNGKFQVRNIDDGKLIYEDSMGSSVAKLVQGDFKMDNNTMVIACSIDGEMKGYVPATEERKGRNLMDKDTDAELIKELLQKKDALQRELALYENNLKQIKTGNVSTSAVPTNTKLLFSVVPQLDQQRAALLLKTNNDTLIRFASVSSDNLFEEDSRVIYPPQAQSELYVPLKPSTNTACEVSVKAAVGYLSGEQDHVFEMSYQLPRFGLYFYVQDGTHVKVAQSKLRFSTTERVNRILLWMDKSCSFPAHSRVPTNPNLPVKMHFQSVRDGSTLVFQLSKGENNSSVVEIYNDDVEVVGDVMQDLCSYLQIDQMESQATFPEEIKEFRQVLSQVQEFNTIRMQLTADIADRTQLLKTYAIKAEDSRTLNDMTTMNHIYSQLFNLNQELIGEFRKRANNLKQLQGKLKEVHSMIEKASRLRMGDAKQKVIGMFRKAIQANNPDQIVQIIQTGHVSE